MLSGSEMGHPTPHKSAWRHSNSAAGHDHVKTSAGDQMAVYESSNMADNESEDLGSYSRFANLSISNTRGWKSTASTCNMVMSY